MFGCIHVWHNLGRLNFIYTQSNHKRIFSVGQIFNEFSIEYRIASCNWQTGEFHGFIKGEFENSKFVSLCPDSNLLVNHDGCVVKIWDLQTKREKHKFEIGDAEISSSFVSEDGEKIFASSYENYTYVWNLKTHELIYKLRGVLPLYDRAFIISPSRNIILGRDQKVITLLKAWDYETGQELWCIDTSLQSVKSITSIIFKPNSNILLTGSLDGKISFWNILTGQKIDSLQIEEGVGRIALSSDGKLLIVGCRHGNINILDLEKNEKFQIISAHGRSRVEAISMLGKQHFISAGWDGSLKVWAKQ